MNAKGFVMLYPNFKNQTSFSTRNDKIAETPNKFGNNIDTVPLFLADSREWLFSHLPLIIEERNLIHEAMPIIGHDYQWVDNIAKLIKNEKL